MRQHLLGEDVALHRRPVLAAPLDRPIRYSQAMRVHDTLAFAHILRRGMPARRTLVPNLRGYFRAEESAHLVAEGHFFRRVSQVHGLNSCGFAARALFIGQHVGQ